jgi:hypothetical protein
MWPRSRPWPAATPEAVGGVERPDLPPP